MATDDGQGTLSCLKRASNVVAKGWQCCRQGLAMLLLATIPHFCVIIIVAAMAPVPFVWELMASAKAIPNLLAPLV